MFTHICQIICLKHGLCHEVHKPLQTLSIKAPETAQYFFKSIQIFQKMKFGIATLIILGLVLTIGAIPHHPGGGRQEGSSEEDGSSSSEEEGGPGVTMEPIPQRRRRGLREGSSEEGSSSSEEEGGPGVTMEPIPQRRRRGLQEGSSEEEGSSSSEEDGGPGATIEPIPEPER